MKNETEPVDINPIGHGARKLAYKFRLTSRHPDAHVKKRAYEKQRERRAKTAKAKQGAEAIEHLKKEAARANDVGAWREAKALEKSVDALEAVKEQVERKYKMATFGVEAREGAEAMFELVESRTEDAEARLARMQRSTPRRGKRSIDDLRGRLDAVVHASQLPQFEGVDAVDFPGPGFDDLSEEDQEAFLADQEAALAELDEVSSR